MRGRQEGKTERRCNDRKTGQSEAGQEPRKLQKLENIKNQILSYSL